MVSPQIQAAATRMLAILGAMIAGGLIALYPQIIDSKPLDKDALIRAFVGGAIGVIVSRIGEGVGDTMRAQRVSAGDASGLSHADVGVTHALSNMHNLNEAVLRQVTLPVLSSLQGERLPAVEETFIPPCDPPRPPAVPPEGMPQSSVFK